MIIVLKQITNINANELHCILEEMSSPDKHVRTAPSHADTLASTLDHLSNPKYTNIPDLPLLKETRRYFVTKQRLQLQFLLIFSLPLSTSDYPFFAFSNINLH